MTQEMKILQKTLRMTLFNTEQRPISLKYFNTGILFLIKKITNGQIFN